jgi:hypothetical protein
MQRLTERPILFSGEMVRAILEGRKTQTRRVITGLPDDFAHAKAHFQTVNYDPAKGWWEFSVASGGGIDREVKVKGFRARLKVREYDLRTTDVRRCPYGLVGERLWVRENWWCNPGIVEARRDLVWDEKARKALDRGPVFYAADGGECPAGWRPSIHLPRWASRIFLEVTKIRAERLHKCSEADALAEGFPPTPVTEEQIAECELGTKERAIAESMRGGEFSSLFNFGFAWDQRNEKRGFAWSTNPWVWVVDFKVVEAAR